MQVMRQPRAWVSALTLGLQLLTVAHMVVVDHTLSSSGEMVHARDAAGHDHDVASLCADEVPAQGPACDVVDRWSRVEVSRVEFAVRVSVPTDAPRTPRAVMAGRRPLSWAPKASPPRA
jgi:hypothetical protein